MQKHNGKCKMQNAKTKCKSTMENGKFKSTMQNAFLKENIFLKKLRKKIPEKIFPQNKCQK